MLAAQNLSLRGRLDNVSIALRPGELTAVCGPNGAGKSSLLAALAGVLPGDAGSVAVDERPLPAMPPSERARLIGYLPQVQDVAWDIDVRTLCGLGRLPWRSGAESDRAIVARVLEQLDLVQLAERPVSRLSGGERARALLARVLAGEPRWILADEPLAALDLAHQAALLRIFRRLVSDGLGVAVVLHDLARAMNAADRVIVLDHGRIVADGPPAVALEPATIAAVWGTQARWLGEPGALALSLG